MSNDQEEDYASIYTNPGQRDGQVYDSSTGEFVRCRDANCARCTRNQLDLCPGFDDETEWENDEQDSGEDF